MNALWDNFLKAKTLIKVAVATLERRPERTIKYGFLTSVLLTIGFVCLNSIGVSGGIFIFPLLYFIFLTPGIYYTLWKLSPTGKHGSVEYFEGLKAGTLTTLYAVLFYSLFMAVYISLNGNALTFISESSPFGILLDPFAAGLGLFFEGLAFGITITFSLMQYFKKD